MLSRAIDVYQRLVTMPIRIDRLVFWSKSWVVRTLFTLGVALAYFNSLHPWFLWVNDAIINVLIFALLACSFVINQTMQRPFVVNRFWLGYVLPFALVTFIMFSSNGGNFFGFVGTLIRIAYVALIFYSNTELLSKAVLFVSKCMAVLLCLSMAGFLLYLMGRSLPSTSAVYGDNVYSFSNYYLFMVSDVDMWTLIPRFQSVFLEPSHMAVACVFLLAAQIGQWTKWYNLVLIFATLISFSVEGYVLLVVLFFGSKWVLRKNFVRNVVILGVAIVGIVIGSFFYNDGDNLVNQLIVMRLEVDDGEVAGNNRTTEGFDAEFDSFLSSSDVLMGREMLTGFGNSGYKVFIYQYGLVGVAFLLWFYAVLLYAPRNIRPAMVMFALSLIHFIVRAHMTMDSCFLLVFLVAQGLQYPIKRDE